MKVLDLFSGIGGFALGLSKAGYEVGGFCEIEPHCVAVLNKNFPDVPVHQDIQTLTVQRGEYDVMCGGFPCQDISIAGKGAGILKGKKSSLWSEFKRVIKDGQPKYAIIENVNALLGRGLEIILQDLAEIGYDATWTTYDSKYFGVPQRRRRVYIVAVRDGIKANTDLFEFSQRDSSANKTRLESFNQSFEWDFAQGNGVEQAFTYLTRQRSDEFKGVGLSSALLKRDYKDFMDVVVCGDNVRRVTPDERLALQGFPRNWFDDCGLTNTQKYMCNGMTINVVAYIAQRLKLFDILNSKPEGATFYSLGLYRKEGMTFDSEHGWFESVFSDAHLSKKHDYIRLA